MTTWKGSFPVVLRIRTQMSPTVTFDMYVCLTSKRAVSRKAKISKLCVKGYGPFGTSVRLTLSSSSIITQTIISAQDMNIINSSTVPNDIVSDLNLSSASPSHLLNNVIDSNPRMKEGKIKRSTSIGTFVVYTSSCELYQRTVRVSNNYA